MVHSVIKNETYKKLIKMALLTFFCGKMGSGKSTHAKKIALKENAVLLSEDEWLSAVFPNKITSLNEYLYHSNLLKPPIKKLAQSILITGTDVVMDFPGNTVKQRQWIKTIYSEINASHQLIFIDASDEVCLRQINTRCVEQPERSLTDTKEMFTQMSRYFVAPSIDEGFCVTQLSRI